MSTAGPLYLALLIHTHIYMWDYYKHTTLSALFARANCASSSL